MLLERRFFDSNHNPRGGSRKALVDNRDGTLTDRTTGLMWQKAGADDAMDYDNARKYVRRLKHGSFGSQTGFAGYRDWRLPTLEEAASLLDAQKRNGYLYIDPLFEGRQFSIWTSDPSSENRHHIWIVRFNLGNVLWRPRGSDNGVRACRGAAQEQAVGCDPEGPAGSRREDSKRRA